MTGSSATSPFGYFPTKRKYKVTLAQLEEIERRYLDGETAQALALEFGISASYIYHFAGRRRA